MLYELMIQGEDARWETFKNAEQEAHRRNALRAHVGGRRLRRLFQRMTDQSPRTAAPPASAKTANR